MSQLKYWDGTAWVNAVIGAQGVQGLIGSQGTQGIQGITGTGTQGTAGTGVQGVQGLQGTAGGGGSSSLTLISSGYTGYSGVQSFTGLSGYSNIRIVITGYNGSMLTAPEVYLNINGNSTSNYWNTITGIYSGPVGTNNLNSSTFAAGTYGDISYSNIWDGLTFTTCIDLSDCSSTGYTKYTITSSFSGTDGAAYTFSNNGVFQVNAAVTSASVTGEFYDFPYRVYGS